MICFCVNLSFWRYISNVKSTKSSVSWNILLIHYIRFIDSTPIACLFFHRTQSPQFCSGLSACLDFLHRAATENASLTLFAKLRSQAFLHVTIVSWCKIHHSSWYLHEKFMIFNHIGSYWFMLIHDWSCVHALCNAVAVSFQILLFFTWCLRVFVTAFSGSFAFSLILMLDWSQSYL